MPMIFTTLFDFYNSIAIQKRQHYFVHIDTLCNDSCLHLHTVFAKKISQEKFLAYLNIHYINDKCAITIFIYPSSSVSGREVHL